MDGWMDEGHLQSCHYQTTILTDCLRDRNLVSEREVRLQELEGLKGISPSRPPRRRDFVYLQSAASNEWKGEVDAEKSPVC